MTPTPVSRASTPESSPKPASGPANVLFIVDSSGSMKAKARGKTRMEAAKEVVNQLIGELPAGTNVGLMSYGHRHTKDCKDIEVLLPMGPVSVGPFREKVNTLQPLGETPISASIRQGAELFAGIRGKKNIILISDGEESCQEDACGVAAALKKADVELTIHVVGFGLDKASAKGQMACIAEATGGEYREASNASELKKALEGLAKSDGDKGRLVVDQLDSHGKRIFWCVEVYPEGVTGIPNRVFETCSEGNAAENAFEIKPGRYDVWPYGASLKSKPGKQTVEIVAGQDTKLSLEQAGRLFLNIVDQNGAAVQYVAQVKSLTENTSGSGTFYSGEAQDLMPGTYDISMWGGPAGIPNKTEVVIRPGEETRIDITIQKP